MRRASVISGGAQDQPIFQPVRLNVLPVEERVTVRSRIPGRLARGTWGASNTMCSYTSSVTARRSCLSQTGAVGVVERLEEHDLVARLEECLQGHEDGLGAARVDRDLPFGVVFEGVEAALMSGHGFRQRPQADHPLVLVVAAPDGGDRRVLH